MMTRLNGVVPSALVAAAIAIAVTGCASTARQDLQLDEARASVAAAHGDPLVVGDAQAELARADAALASANAAMAASRPLADVDHDALIADRFARAAQQHGQLLDATRQIAEADSRRNTVLLDAREHDVHRATVVAERKTLEASVARVEARDSAADARESAADARDSAAVAVEANTRADRLDAQLADLRATHTDRGTVVTLGDVLFATGESGLLDGSQRSLAGLTAFLSSHPQRSVRIEGYTDNVGTEGYNRDLSDRRAGAVADVLRRGGIGSTRIQAEGYGMAFPVASNESAAGRQQNRRVEVVISEDNQQVADHIR